MALAVVGAVVVDVEVASSHEVASQEMESQGMEVARTNGFVMGRNAMLHCTFADTVYLIMSDRPGS